MYVSADLSSNTCCVNTQFKQNLEKNTADENIVIRQIMTGVLIFMTPMTKLIKATEKTCIKNTLLCNLNLFSVSICLGKLSLFPFCYKRLKMVK